MKDDEVIFGAKKYFFYWSLPVSRTISPIRGIPGILKIRIGMCAEGAKGSWLIS